MQKCPNSLSTRGQDKSISLIGTMDMGSWVHSILSPIYGDYHVIDKKYTQLSCLNDKLL